MSKFKIFVLQTVGGISSGTGGGSLHHVGLAHEWSKLGHEVHFVTNSRDPATFEYDDLYRVYRLSALNGFLFAVMFNFIFQMRQIKGIFAQTKTSGCERCVVIAESSFPSDVLAAFYVARNFKISALVYFHHLSPPPWKHPFKRGGLLRTTINWCMNQFALTLVKIGGLLPAIDHPVEIVNAGWKFPCGILKDDAFLQNEVVSNETTKDKEYGACFIGRIAVNKGVVDLIHIWKKVSWLKPRVKLIIAGQSNSKRLEKKLYLLRKRLKLEDKIIFIFRYVSENEKREILNKSALFVFPSYEEGWSLSVMEAAAYGILPITYDLPAYDYLGPKAVKAKTGDIEEFAKKTITFLEETGNRIKLASDLKDKVMKYRLSDIAEYQLKRFEQFIREGRIID